MGRGRRELVRGGLVDYLRIHSCFFFFVAALNVRFSKKSHDERRLSATRSTCAPRPRGIAMPVTTFALVALIAAMLMRSTAVSGFERKGNARVRVTGREFILDAATCACEWRRPPAASGFIQTGSPPQQRSRAPSNGLELRVPAQPDRKLTDRNLPKKTSSHHQIPVVL